MESSSIIIFYKFLGSYCFLFSFSLSFSSSSWSLYKLEEENSSCHSTALCFQSSDLPTVYQSSLESSHSSIPRVYRPTHFLATRKTDLQLLSKYYSLRNGLLFGIEILLRALIFFIFLEFILHLFYLHFHSSYNPLKLNTNNKISFFSFIFKKDLYFFMLILCLYLLQNHYGISSFSHPDNALEVCVLLTPLHIVPEWYFLSQYAMLKAVPNKNAGFIILLSSIFTFFFIGEIRNSLSTGSYLLYLQASYFYL